MVVRTCLVSVAMAAFSLVSVLGGCGGSPGSTDTAPDAGSAVDSGTVTPDAGDASTPVADSGAPETGADAAPPDAGPTPRADIPGVACNDTIADVYITPSGLPPMDASHRGDIVRCAEDFALEESDAQAEVTAKGITMTATTGVSVYRVAYRTMRGTGLAGISTRPTASRRRARRRRIRRRTKTSRCRGARSDIRPSFRTTPVSATTTRCRGTSTTTTPPTRRSTARALSESS